MFGKKDFDNLDYPVMENVYAYVIPNGTKQVSFTFFENNSCVKKLYVPASVDWLWIENWYEAPSKTTDNVWVEVSPENPYVVGSIPTCGTWLLTLLEAIFFAQMLMS